MFLTTLLVKPAREEALQLEPATLVIDMGQFETNSKFPAGDTRRGAGQP